jgi:acetate---CoA ligase (ADP-forming)
MNRDLSKLFFAKSIAIIGATNKPGKVGYSLVNNLKNYNGDLFYINTRLNKMHKKIFDKKVYENIKDIPNSNLDLAIIAVPSRFVLNIIDELNIKHCKNIILISSGFNEKGNNVLSENLIKIVNKYKMNLIGPNCLGILNLNNNLNATFNSEKLKYPKFGNVSIISQSGALGSAILDLAHYESLGVSKFISYGNALDIDECDLLNYFYNDKTTDVIFCYIEGIKNGRLFFNTLKKICKKKKVLILKGGLSQKGNTAAKSHTAAIASSSKVLKAAINQSGAYLVDSIEELFFLGKLFSIYKNIKINNIQLITNGGGFGVLCSDQLDKYKITLSKMNLKTKNKISKLLPNYSIIDNPLDLSGDSDTKRFIDCANICLNCKQVDALAILILFQLPGIDKNIIVELVKLRKNLKKPLFILCFGGSQTNKYIEKLEQNNIVCFKNPMHLAKSLNYLKI